MKGFFHVIKEIAGTTRNHEFSGKNQRRMIYLPHEIKRRSECNLNILWTWIGHVQLTPAFIKKIQWVTFHNQNLHHRKLYTNDLINRLMDHEYYFGLFCKIIRKRGSVEVQISSITYVLKKSAFLNVLYYLTIQRSQHISSR